MKCILAGETEILGENLPQRHFCSSQNPAWPDPDLNPGRRGGKPATNRLSYGAALVEGYFLFHSTFTFKLYLFVFNSLFILLLQKRDNNLRNYF
jgi:hypothetical protein